MEMSGPVWPSDGCCTVCGRQSPRWLLQSVCRAKRHAPKHAKRCHSPKRAKRCPSPPDAQGTFEKSEWFCLTCAFRGCVGAFSAAPVALSPVAQTGGQERRARGTGKGTADGPAQSPPHGRLPVACPSLRVRFPPSAYRQTACVAPSGPARVDVGEGPLWLDKGESKRLLASPSPGGLWPLDAGDASALLLPLACGACGLFPIPGVGFLRRDPSPAAARRDPLGKDIGPLGTDIGPLGTDSGRCLACFLQQTASPAALPPHDSGRTFGAEAHGRLEGWTAVLAHLPDRGTPLSTPPFPVLPPPPSPGSGASPALAPAAALPAAPAAHGATHDATDGRALKSATETPRRPAARPRPGSPATVAAMLSVVRLANRLVERMARRHAAQGRGGTDTGPEFDLGDARLADPQLRAALHLALAAHGMGQSVQELMLGCARLDWCDAQGVWASLPCLAHLWKDPRPPCRDRAPGKPAASVPLARPSPETAERLPSAAHGVRGRRSVVVELLGADAAEEGPGPVCAVWSSGAGGSARSLEPDVVLAGVWPMDRAGDASPLDPRQSDLAPTDHRTDRIEAAPPAASRDEKEAEPPARAPAAGSLGRACGCAAPRCFPAVRGGRDWARAAPDHYLPRNWMCQAVHLLAMSWKLVCEHVAAVALPDSRHGTGDGPLHSGRATLGGGGGHGGGGGACVALAELLAQPLRVLVVPMQPSETERVPFWSPRSVDQECFYRTPNVADTKSERPNQIGDAAGHRWGACRRALDPELAEALRAVALPHALLSPIAPGAPAAPLASPADPLTPAIPALPLAPFAQPPWTAACSLPGAPLAQTLSADHKAASLGAGVAVDPSPLQPQASRFWRDAFPLHAVSNVAPGAGRAGGPRQWGGVTEVLVARDLCHSVADELQPFPYGFYAFDEATSALVIAVDATEELRDHRAAETPPLVRFLVSWIRHTVQTWFLPFLDPEQSEAILERLSAGRVEDERLSLVLKLLRLGLGLGLGPGPAGGSAAPRVGSAASHSAQEAEAGPVARRSGDAGPIPPAPSEASKDRPRHQAAHAPPRPVHQMRAAGGTQNTDVDPSPPSDAAAPLIAPGPLVAPVLRELPRQQVPAIPAGSPAAPAVTRPGSSERADAIDRLVAEIGLVPPGHGPAQIGRPRHAAADESEELTVAEGLNLALDEGLVVAISRGNVALSVALLVLVTALCFALVFGDLSSASGRSAPALRRPG
jgi:hypothetical protein